MKKLIAWIMMLCMVMGLLCGCSDDSGSSRKKDRDEGNESGENREDENLEDDDWELAEPEDEERPEEKRDDEEETTVVFENPVLYDANGIKVTATGVTVSRATSNKEIQILIENNTERNIVLKGYQFLVNGIVVEGSMGVKVLAGKNVTDVISIDKDSLEISDIEKLATVSCVDGYIVDIDTSDSFDMQFELRTSIAEGYQQKIDDSGEVILQEAGVTVIFKGISEYDNGERAVMYVKNDSDVTVMVKINEPLVNGNLVDHYMYYTLPVGTSGFCSLDIVGPTLEYIGVESVEDITVKIVVEDTYSAYNDVLCESGELVLRAQ